ncbi:MAG: dihydroorotate dehydrogenase 2, partial [Dehalococcoidia bacterium]|nr:dihydroorotate dehydrogenase 2 [Dehalococcoidia bacterium]
MATDICGVKLSSPIGLAAGFDKNCYAIGGLYDLGFGFVVGGTITLNARSGNAKPRLIRVPSDSSLINSLGFPNKGISAAIKNLELKRNSKIPNIFVSISGNSLDEIITCQKMITNICTLIEINISSPNSLGLRRFHQKESLERLIQTLNDLKTCPLFLKIPPLFTSDVENKEVLNLIETANLNSIDGLVTSNSHPVSTNQLAVGTGGLSGAPLLE